MESNQLTLSGVDSTIWWGGLTANLTLTNHGDEPLSDWTYTFLTHHRVQDETWGLQVINQTDAGDGLSRITIQGRGYGQRINPGDSITVGFNAEQGFDLGTAGKATQDQVLLSDHDEDQQSDYNDSTSDAAVAIQMDDAGMDDAGMGHAGIDHAGTGHSSSDQSSHHHDAMNHDGMDHGTPDDNSGPYQDINVWGNFHGSNNNSEHNELVGGRTAITTEALVAYNAVRTFAGLQPATIEQVGQWAFDNQLTNNSQAWGNDLQGVGLWYAMQGAKVAWIADETYDPQILADIQRTARLGNPDDVIQMVRTHGHKGFADFLQQNNLQESFINTLKMEPHYGGWMHGRTHGFLNIENGAIAHDINHLTVLGWDQSQPFMNDTFDWPQWPALNVDDQTVINYYQSIVSLGNPLADNLESLPDSPATQISVPQTSIPQTSPPSIPSAPSIPEPETVTDSNHNHDAMNHDGMDHGTPDDNSGPYQDINVWGNFHGSNNNSEHNELVGGRTAITTEALVAYNAVRTFAGLQPATIEQVGQWAFDNQLTNNSQAWGNDLQGVGLWYAMQGAKVAWIADETYDPQILADIQRTARLGNPDDVIQMVRTHGHKGFADFLQQNNLQESFINTLKMEPHYGGWMHGRTHGFLNIENGAIAHDINHLTVLGWDQSQPFMNDTFDWPQWPALNVDDQTVINYYQSIVSLGNPLADNLESLPDSPATQISVPQTSIPQTSPPSIPSAPSIPEPETVTPIANTENDEPSPTLTSAGGQIWWGGLTANLTFTNQSDEVMDDWDFTFTTPHRIQSSQWGLELLDEVAINDRLTRYTIQGSEYGETIRPGESVTIGFNATQGTELGTSGTPTLNDLFQADAMSDQIPGLTTIDSFV